jgi:hypothetical protein
MIVLAIDPGTTQSAYVVFDGRKVIRGEILPNENLLQLMRDDAIAPHDVVACEMVASYGMAVGREVFETCVWIGRFIQVARAPVRMVFRKDVKMHLCHSMRAKDGNIRQALLDKHGAVGTKKNPGPLYGVKSHLWAALAVADYAASVPVETAA